MNEKLLLENLLIQMDTYDLFPEKAEHLSIWGEVVRENAELLNIDLNEKHPSLEKQVDEFYLKHTSPDKHRFRDYEVDALVSLELALRTNDFQTLLDLAQREKTNISAKGGLEIQDPRTYEIQKYHNKSPKELFPNAKKKKRPPTSQKSYKMTDSNKQDFAETVEEIAQVTTANTSTKNEHSEPNRKDGGQFDNTV